MTSIEKFEKETGLEYFEYLEETGYLVPIEYVKWLEKQCALHDVLNSTLEIKEAINLEPEPFKEVDLTDVKFSILKDGCWTEI